ncbi:MAG: protein translocase subunit SecD [Anaerolineae bacterium]|nr:protein translocase subunit SecD [Anaerolineae bacterium]
MRERNLLILLGIILLVAFCLWIDLPQTEALSLQLGPLKIYREIKFRLGLDLRGGLQVVLEADPPPGEKVTPESMEAVRNIIQNRVDGMGVVEAVVQRQGENRILVELPGLVNPDEAIATLKATGRLEFVEAGLTPLPEGLKILTTYEVPLEPSPTETITPPPGAAPTPPPTITPTVTLTPTTEITPTPQVYRTIMTGKHLKSARVGSDEFGRPEIDFELTREGAEIFAKYTTEHQGEFLAIVMDGIVISCPQIKEPITDGMGRITSEKGFTLEEARRLAIILQYGALPVPLKVIQTRIIGPTLGQDSIQKSIRAGIIGVIVVLTFMLTYYRLPGFLADLALISYGLINLAIYKFGIPGLFPGVTLSLPGITGFLLSTGMAVDANILIFERMKEELRQGRPLSAAIEAGFNRAWTSIRDANLSTLLTCIVLYWFGSNFGASMVKGFAVTLFIGVCVSMFTAVTMTRTLVTFVFDLSGRFLEKRRWLLGV